jgi:hypothetical protein
VPVKKKADMRTIKKNSATAKKTTAAKKSASASEPADRREEVAKRISGEIVAGTFDGYLILFDDALTTRANAQAAEARKNAAKSPAPVSEKKVGASPKKSTKPAIVPEKDKQYLVGDRIKSLAGAKVKFLRFKADTDGAKSVVEMLTDKPGNPKGKVVSVPTIALEAVPTAAKGKRIPAKKK